MSDQEQGEPRIMKAQEDDIDVGDSDQFFGQEKQEQSQKQDQLQDPNVVQKKKHIHKKKKSRKSQKLSKKPKLDKQKQKNERYYKMTQKRSQELIQEMSKAYEKDVDLLKLKRPAFKRIKYLESLTRELKNKYIAFNFLEMNGLQEFEKWLTKIQVGRGEFIEPSFSLKKEIFQVLEFLPVRDKHLIRAQQLQRIIQKHKRSPVKELKNTAQQILTKWMYCEQNQ